MKVKIPLMVQDPTTAHIMGIKPVEGSHPEAENFYTDGPVTKRVAILDFDANTGDLHKGARFVQPKGRLPYFEYADLPVNPNDTQAFKDYFESERSFNQVSILGTILRTLYLFEDDYVLGRRVTWAFDSPQLLVVPRAGQWANAFYQRETHSIQFFFFPSAKDPKHTIYTSLSRDIIAHETAHAILDGIAPYLYDSLTPQSLALHEAIADLTAVLAAAKSHNLVLSVLEKTRGAISDSTAFSSIAPEFGMGRDPDGKAEYLRQLFNPKTIRNVPIDEPHLLSEVLSGALYIVLEKMHEEHRARFSKESPFKEKEDPMHACSGKSLAAAGFRLKNTIFRALDYLPPGDITFSDYAKTIMAVDKAANLNKPEVRDWFKEEFVKRQIVPNEKALDLETNFVYKPLQNVDFERVCKDDKTASQFAEQFRGLLNIPPHVPFKVLPRTNVKKIYYDVEREKININEIIFKVSWEQPESNPFGYKIPDQRTVTMGTTLAIDADKHLVRFLLSSDQSQEQCNNRDQMLSRLIEDGILRLDEQAVAPDGKLLDSVVLGDTRKGFLRIRGAARLLHIAE